MINDAVKHPSHYIGDYGMETIDVIKNFANVHSGYKGYLAGNVIKYICRWSKKNGKEDLKKARVYLDMLIDEVDGAENNYGLFPGDEIIDGGTEN